MRSFASPEQCHANDRDDHQRREQHERDGAHAPSLS
jgi:hypothetical protein